MDLVFEEATEQDIPELTTVMTLAFDDDAHKHLGQDRGGPPGYDNGDFFRQWLLPYKESVGYKVLSAGTLVGFVLVWILPEGENILGTIFVHPDHQDQGVGSRTWQFVEETYPETRSWTLHTPSWATSNHRFYEKCGFRKIGERQESDGMILWVYQKVMQTAGPQATVLS